jgi:hypothetical protein
LNLVVPTILTPVPMRVGVVEDMVLLKTLITLT